MMTTKTHQAYRAVPAGVARVTLKAWVPPADLARAATAAVRGWTYLGCTTHLTPCSVSLSFELLAAAGADHEAIAERALEAIQGTAVAYNRVLVHVLSGYKATEHREA
jgi:hypothetical protein